MCMKAVGLNPEKQRGLVNRCQTHTNSSELLIWTTRIKPMLKWHQIQGLAGETSQLVKSWGMRDKWRGAGQKENSRYQLKSPSIRIHRCGRPKLQKHISCKIKEMPMPWKWCVESMYIILDLCMHTKKKNPHHKMLVFKYIHQLHLHDLAFSSFHIFFEIKCPSK